MAANSFSLGLKSGGILVIDYLNINVAIKELVREEEIQRSDIAFHIKRFIKDNKIIKEIELKDHEGQAHFFQEKVAAFGLNDFIDFFKKGRMELKNTFGDYHLNPFNEEKSPRLIMIFEKK